MSFKGIIFWSFKLYPDEGVDEEEDSSILFKIVAFESLGVCDDEEALAEDADKFSSQSGVALFLGEMAPEFTELL